MARKDPHPTSSQSKAPLIVLIAGGLAVAGLVAWAMMRSMDAPVAAGFHPPPGAAPIQTATSTAAATATPPPNPEHAAVPRITADELRAKMDRGEVTVIDVRDADAFLRGHIPGARHIPLARVEGEIDYLPRAKQIVFYCT